MVLNKAPEADSYGYYRYGYSAKSSSKAAHLNPFLVSEAAHKWHHKQILPWTGTEPA